MYACVYSTCDLFGDDECKEPVKQVENQLNAIKSIQSEELSEWIGRKIQEMMKRLYPKMSKINKKCPLVIP